MAVSESQRRAEKKYYKKNKDDLYYKKLRSYAVKFLTEMVETREDLHMYMDAVSEKRKELESGGED